MNPLFICFWILTAFGPTPACYRYQPVYVPPPPTYWQATMPIAAPPVIDHQWGPPCHVVQPGLSVCG